MQSSKAYWNAQKSFQIAVEFRETQDIMNGNIFCAIKRKKTLSQMENIFWHHVSFCVKTHYRNNQPQNT